MMWVLIILWFPASSQSGKVVHTQEFNAQARCEAAASAIVHHTAGTSDLLRAWCTAK